MRWAFSRRIASPWKTWPGFPSPRGTTWPWAYPYEMFAVPLREVVRIHSSTGSPGNPIVMGYTARDLRHWARLAARVLTAAGVDRDDVVQVTLSYGLLTSAFGLHYGVEHLGASVIPAGPGGAARQIQVMRDYRTTVLASTPSYALGWLTRLTQQPLCIAS